MRVTTVISIIIVWCLPICHLLFLPPLVPFPLPSLSLSLTLTLFFLIPLSGTYFFIPLPPSLRFSVQLNLQVTRKTLSKFLTASQREHNFFFFLTLKKSNRHLANFETESVSSSSLPRRGEEFSNAQNGHAMIWYCGNGTDVSLFSLSSFLVRQWSVGADNM
ncbi:hypothetical protein HOY80DRAFT_154944 [Tuber brumale]|nr:hypothetical protein HOY80DRAFT_154944 [Tuber brumale]